MRTFGPGRIGSSRVRTIVSDGPMIETELLIGFKDLSAIWPKMQNKPSVKKLGNYLILKICLQLDSFVAPDCIVSVQPYASGCEMDDWPDGVVMFLMSWYHSHLVLIRAIPNASLCISANSSIYYRIHSIYYTHPLSAIDTPFAPSFHYK